MGTCKKCNKISCFNFENQKFGEYCNIHKLDNMINVTVKKCHQSGCNKRRSFNYEGSRPKYCSDHKLVGMIDTINKICIHDNCNNRAYYNIPNNKPIYCRKHKLDNMINVTSKKCREKNCNIVSSYNYYGMPPIYCVTHKLNNMIRITNLCTYEGCNKKPSYGNLNTKLRYCFQHKLDGMENIISLRCKTLSCNKIITKKYNGYCPRCYIKNNPNIDTFYSRNKEYYVINYVLDNFKNYNWICGKKLITHNSYRIADLYLDITSHIIIIEIDEFQHKKYNQIDDNKRLLDIKNFIDNKPLIFIKFNPDSYIDIYNNNIKSCWKKINNVTKLVKYNEWSNRLLKLKSIIEYYINHNSLINENFKIIELYYNGYESDIIYTDKIPKHTYKYLSDSSLDSNINLLNKSNVSSDSDNNNLNIYKTNILSEPNIVYFSDLSSDSDNNNLNIYKTNILSEPNIVYFSDLSSDDDYTPTYLI